MTNESYAWNEDGTINLEELFYSRLQGYTDSKLIDPEAIVLAKLFLNNVQQRTKYTSGQCAELAVAMAEQIVVTHSGFSAFGRMIASIRKRLG